MRSDYRVRAKRMCRMLYDYIVNCLPDPSSYCRAVKQFNRRYSYHMDCKYGSSRIAFILSDYVIKIDYCDTDWGSCEDELENYERARQDGYEYLLAEITPYYYKQHMFYIMPRVRVSGCTLDYSIDEYLNWDEWQYLSEHFEDLHDGNWGLKNGHVVIYDYACRNFYNDEE